MGVVGRGRRRPRAVVDERDLAEEVARFHRPDDLAVDVDLHGAVDDHEELRARGALPRQDLAGRHVDLLGQLTDLFDVVARQVLEQRDLLEQLELVVDLCHLSLSDGHDGRRVRAAYRSRLPASRPASRLHLAAPVPHAHEDDVRCPRAPRPRQLRIPRSATPPPSPTARTGPARGRCSRRSASPTRTSPSRSSASATTWIETMPCNYNQRRLAECVKEGIRAAGGTPMEFNTISVSDGVTMGTEGMKASLISREVIADSIELVVRGHLLDGVVCLVGCDKTMPGAAMALGPPRRPRRSRSTTGRSTRACTRATDASTVVTRLRGDRRVPGGQDQPRRAVRDRERRVSRARAPAAASTRPTR